MSRTFKADCMAVLIGSIPMDNHKLATDFMLKYTPDIPLWVQLPKNPQESMINQFLPGLPGIAQQDNKIYLDTSGDAFQIELLEFYEEYLAVTEDYSRLADSRFSLTAGIANGFFELKKTIASLPSPPKAIKGQITGPITMSIGVKDQHGKSLFYDDTLKDVMVKTLALKARWQVEQMAGLAQHTIIFFDEPGIVSFGSAAFISISREQIHAVIAEVVDSVHAAGGLAGIHICATGDWSLALESNTDILSFDAYNFFDKFILYADLVKKFMSAGGILAWGIVPTSNPDDIDKESVDSLIEKWLGQVDRVTALGIERSQLLAQSLITPSCGTGSLSLAHATKVLELTKGVSEKIRRNEGLC